MIDQAGQLDRRITIQTFSEATDAFGQEVKTFSTLGSVWANVKERVGREGEEGDIVQQQNIQDPSNTSSRCPQGIFKACVLVL